MIRHNMKNLMIILVLGSLVFSCTSTRQTKPELGEIWKHERFGSIENRSILDSLLSATTNMKIDSTKPLVVIYYPGKDRCNSSGSATRSSRRSWYNEMERGINRISKSNIVYIYKDTTGLYDGNDAFKDWYEDPENTIEQLFFETHPPCGGYLLLSKKGDYISYGAEFDKAFLWKRFKYLTN